jgi:hypothetical protein
MEEIAELGKPSAPAKRGPYKEAKATDAAI